MSEEKKYIPKRRFKEFKNADAWEQCKLGEVADVRDGTHDSPQYCPKGHPFITSKNVKDGFVNYDDIQYISNDDFKEINRRSKVDKNDILMGMIGTVGNLALVREAPDFAIKNVALIKNTKGNYHLYLYYYLQSSNVSNQLEEGMDGGTQKFIALNKIRNIIIAFPEIEEQYKIGNHMEHLNNLITLHQHKLEKMKALKKAYLSEMFPAEGECKPKRRFAGFNDDWEQRKLGDCGTFYYGHSCPKWSVTKDAKIPCIRYGELYTKFGTKIDKVFSYTNMPPDKLRFSKGTEVLIPRVGEDPTDYNHCTWLSLADVAIGEMISVFNTDQNPLFTATMFNATLQEEFACRVEGGSVTNLYYERLKNIVARFPSIDEQVKIATYFQQIDNLITLHQRKLNKLQNIKKAYLNEMFV